MHLSLYHDSIDRLHQENLQFLKAQQYRRPRRRNYQAEQQAVQVVCRVMKSRGLYISLTVKNAPFDAWVSETPTSQAFRLEIKGATWGDRYQAAIRNYSADLLIFDCINSADHLFIIPMAAIKPRRNIAVWSRDPAAYRGQWAPYLNGWDHLEHALKIARHHPRQLPLSLEF
jgi:hypothetical protein